EGRLYGATFLIFLLIIACLRLWPAKITGKEKTHGRRRPSVLVEIAFCATSHGGIVNDDHQDRNLQRSQNHQWQTNRVCPGGSSLESEALPHPVWRKSDFGNGYASRQPWCGGGDFPAKFRALNS